MATERYANTPARMWTLARAAALAGWDVTVTRTGTHRFRLILLDPTETGEGIEAIFGFWHTTSPDGPGSWRTDEVHRLKAGRRGSATTLRDAHRVMADRKRTA